METFFRLREEHLLTIASGLLFLFTFLTIVCAVAVVQWRKARQHDSEVQFKKELVADGWSVEDIERLLGAKEPQADPAQGESHSDPNSRPFFRSTEGGIAGMCA